MLKRHIWSRSAISRVLISIAVTGAILLLTAAGSNVAVFSTANPSNLSPGGRRISPAVSCVSPPDGLVSWWPGNGSPSDLRGGRNAALFNGATYASGQVGQGFGFDGVNGYASVPANGNWAFGTGDFTVEFWMYSATNDDRRPLVNNRRGPGGIPNMWAIEIYNVANRVEFHSGTTILLTATTLLTNSSWNHVAVTRTGTTLSMYINGSPAGSVSNSDNFSEVNDLQIGRDLLPVAVNDLGGKYFQGTMDEISIYNRSLSAAEIAAVFNAGGEGKCNVCTQPPSGLVSWWAGDGNALDNKGTNHAALFNGANYTAGEVNQAFGFNGAVQYLSIPQTASLPVRGTNSFTIEAWVNHQGDAANDLFNVFAYRNGGQDIQFFVTRTQIGIWGTSAAGMIILTNHGVNPATWNHYAFTRDGNTWRVYVNGNQVGGDATNAVSLLTPTTPQNIGTTGLANTQFAVGMIDEIGIYSRALSQTEIQATQNAATAGKCRSCKPAPVGLVSLWQAENHALDARSRNNGTLQNGTVYSLGKVGQAFNFDGLTQYVEIPDNPSLRPTNGMTLEGWFKFNIASPSGALIAKPWSTSSNDSYVMWTQLGQLAAGINVGIVSGPFSPVPGEWYHIAYTYDEATFQHRLFVNGEVLDSDVFNADPVYDSASVLIGIDKDSGFPVFPLYGSADDVSITDRALTIEEIRQIVFSGSSGKCGPTATIAPSGLVGWWSGDGDVNDVSGQSVGGTLLSAAGYAVGKVGQGFDLNGTLNSGITIPHHSYFNILAPGFTTEFWMKSNGAQPENLSTLVEKSHGWVDSTGWVFTTFSSTNTVHFSIGDGGPGNGSFIEVISNPGILDGNFHHVAGTWDGSDMRLYVDGALQGTTPMASPANNGRGVNFGYTWGNGTPQRYFNGKIDEVSIYNRTLSLAEIQSIHNAGIAGKLKGATTPIGFSAFSRKAERTTSPQVVNTTIGDATVTFQAVTTAGTTQQIPLDLTKLPPLPTGYTPRGLSYDLASTAVWSGTPTVCFNVPALSSAFVNLRIMHLENGNWVDRTLIGGTSPNVCSTALASLSPFALANVTPTAASVSVSGRVTTADGRGIRNARLTLILPDGTRRAAVTSAFGYYAFDGVEVGHTYVLEIAARKYTFGNPTRVFSLQDTVTDMDFTAESQ